MGKIVVEFAGEFVTKIDGDVVLVGSEEGGIDGDIVGAAVVGKVVGNVVGAEEGAIDGDAVVGAMVGPSVA